VPSQYGSKGIGAPGADVTSLYATGGSLILEGTSVATADPRDSFQGLFESLAPCFSTILMTYTDRRLTMIDVINPFIVMEKFEQGLSNRLVGAAATNFNHMFNLLEIEAGHFARL
jgi:hypothetical protein